MQQQTYIERNPDLDFEEVIAEAEQVVGHEVSFPKHLGSGRFDNEERREFTRDVVLGVFSLCEGATEVHLTWDWFYDLVYGRYYNQTRPSRSDAEELSKEYDEFRFIWDLAQPDQRCLAYAPDESVKDSRVAVVAGE